MSALPRTWPEIRARKSRWNRKKRLPLCKRAGHLAVQGAGADGTLQKQISVGNQAGFGCCERTVSIAAASAAGCWRTAGHEPHFAPPRQAALAERILLVQPSECCPLTYGRSKSGGHARRGADRCEIPVVSRVAEVAAQSTRSLDLSPPGQPLRTGVRDTGFWRQRTKETGPGKVAGMLRAQNLWQGPRRRASRSDFDFCHTQKHTRGRVGRLPPDHTSERDWEPMPPMPPPTMPPPCTKGPSLPNGRHEAVSDNKHDSN